jgi:hypothetical protein
MHPFFEMWLPTLLSAVAVFVLSSIIHMVAPFWHRNDYGKLPNEAGVLDALRGFGIPPGEYFAPRPADGSDMRSEEFKEKVKRGPLVILNIATGDSASLARPLILWFVYALVVSALAGHLAFAATRGDPAADERLIFHTVALSAFLAYAAGLWQQVIWFRKPLVPTLKSTVDGVLYALATGGIFCYFWPGA